MINAPTNPTTRTYSSLTEAYDFFNERLFSAKLPPCLITMQRKSKAYGYFAGRRFSTRSGEEVTDEIALNPSHFAGRTTEETLSTLVHEMVHLEQHHFGAPSRTGYHNSEWAQMMRAVGLIPSSTGEPGGKETGQRVSHYIEPGDASRLRAWSSSTRGASHCPMSSSATMVSAKRERKRHRAKRSTPARAAE